MASVVVFVVVGRRRVRSLLFVSPFPADNLQATVTCRSLKLERYIYAEEGGPELCRRLRRRQGLSGLDCRRPHRFLRRAAATAVRRLTLL